MPEGETDMEETKSYGAFAGLYDVLTGDVQYEKRCDYLEEIFGKYAVKKPELIADLGCGTGSVCKILSGRGYDMIGIDSSEEMLMEAISKRGDDNILYLCQDMCDFELYGTVDAVLCMLDSVNYVTDPGELMQMFMLVHNYLNPDGIFVFDVNTLHKFRDVLSDNVFVNDENGVFYTWENSFDGEYCDFRLNFFVENNGLYTRITEEHSQRFYSIDELRDMLSGAGFEIENVYSELKFDSPDEDDERIFFVARAKK